MNRREFLRSAGATSLLGSLLSSMTPEVTQKRIEQLTERKQELLTKALQGDRLAQMWLCPWKMLESPDQWQRDYMSAVVTCSKNGIANASRQSGKTECVAAMAYLFGALGRFVLIVSPSDRQSIEFMRVVQGHHTRLDLGQTVVDPTMHELNFVSSGRVLALPNSPAKIRGFRAVDLVVFEEAAFIPDQVYNAIRPVIAVSRGQTVLISSPFGKRGFFYNEWINAPNSWHRVRVSWRDCPRLTPEWLAVERQRPGMDVEQEYLDCADGDEFKAEVGAYIDYEAHEGCIDPNLQMEW